jgi:PAS domain S-box-containing protein
MIAADFLITLTRDARFSPYAMSAIPAWLWAADASRVIWANATGAAVLSAATPAALTERVFQADEPVAADVARLAGSLPQTGAPRLERLRGIGSNLVCTCSRVSLAGEAHGILVVGSEPARPVLPLAERASRLFSASSEPLAVFSPDGALLYATGALEPGTTLATLGADALKADAVATGRASGDSALGALTLERIGSGAATVLLATLPEARESPQAPREQAPEQLAQDEALQPITPSSPPSNDESAAAAESEPTHEPRPLLTVVPAAKNVVPFRGPPAPEKRPMLTPVERSAFNEIAEALAKGEAPPITPEPPAAETPAPAAEPPAREPEPVAEPEAMPSAFATPVASADASQKNADTQFAILERLPVGVLIHRNENLIYANRAFLEWTGYADLAAVTAAGGLERLVVDPDAGALDRINGTGKTFTIATRTGDTLTCEGRLYTVPWNGESALMLVLVRTAAADRLRDSEIALRAAEAEARELRSILDTATDGVIVVDRDGLVLTFNRSAEALFGYEYHEMARRPFTELFAPESERAARDYLDGLTKNGVASVLNDGREVIGRVRQGGLIPLFMTMGPIGVGMPKFCAVLRDITQWKRAEEDLLNAKRTAERASSAKSDFLAKISHEIRTPLNAIIGFSEVMMGEQFGPIGNERYREYMKDIHASGQHLVSLINDLLDLSKIEAGKLDLVFASVNLNQLVQQCVALMQPQANQQRIIIRSSLSPTLPPVVADARSVRQIVLNLLSNSIKFTGAGGQVIVSTALTDRAEAILRVRDTGIGMTEKEILTAMEPFRQLATSTRYGSGGTGLGLPLTKALAEANRAAFSIKSAVDSGTLVEITFPGTRVLAE